MQVRQAAGALTRPLEASASLLVRLRLLQGIEVDRD